MYNYFLGGKDNYPADRKAAEEVIAASPEVLLFARQNRAFLRRAVRFLATECGIRQFIDIGTGLPSEGNVHEVAPGTRVVYVDNDPVVLAHGRAMLHGIDGTAIINRDLTEPETIFADEQLLSLIDFAEPVAVLLVAVLHFVSDAADPVGIIRTLTAPLAAGSYLVVSHATGDSRQNPADEVREVEKIYERTTTTAHGRTRAEVEAMVAGLDQVEPGLVWGPLWRPEPDTGLADDPGRANMYAVVARCPSRAG